MSSNDPFISNTQNPYSFQEAAPAQLPADMQRGLVHHVTALSILTIVQGSLVTLFGLGLMAMALVMPAMLKAQAEMRPQPRMPARPPMPEHVELTLLFVYGGMGVISLVIGVLGIWAGIRMLKFRGRTLGFVALSSGLLTIAGCYCLPTAIGLFIYGLIVLLNEPVRRAFTMGEQGRTAAEIQNHFSRPPG